MNKILFITPFVPDDHGGGGTSYTKCLLQELSKSNKIDLIYFRYKTSGHYSNNGNISVIKEYTIRKFDKILSLLCLPWIFPLFSARFKWEINTEIQNLIDKGNYDLVYFDFSQTFSYAKFIRHPNKLLMAHDVIGQKYSRSKRYLSRWARWTEEKMLETADAIFTFSEKDCVLLNDWYGVKSQPTTFFLNDSVLNAKPNGCGDYFVMFGSWGRYENYGALEWLMDNVAPHLSQGVKIKIVGGGKLPSDLKVRIDESSIFEYIGFQDNPYDIIANAKAEIAPLKRGAGVKVKCVEALACGTPVIGSEVAFEGISNDFSEFMILASSIEEYVDKINNINIPLTKRLEFKERFCHHYNQKKVLEYISRI